MLKYTNYVEKRCHYIYRVGSCDLCFTLQKCDVIYGKGAHSECRCSLVFVGHCGTFQGANVPCTGRISRLRQPLKCPTPWSVPWLLNKGAEWDTPLVSHSQIFSRQSEQNRWPRSLAKAQPWGRLTDISNNQSKFVSFSITFRGVEMSSQ